MLALTIIVLVFVAVALLVYGIGLMFEPRGVLDHLSYYDQSTEAPSEPLTSTGRFLSAVGRITARHGFAQLVGAKLERAGLPLRPTEYIVVHLAVVVLVGLFAVFLALPFLLVVAFIFAAAIAPIFLLDTLEKRRRERFAEQLPDVLELAAGSLRAGCGLLQAVDLIVEEILPPASIEFARVYTEARLGMPVEDALRKMAERLDNDNLRWVCSAIDIQREVGGNLAEVLDIVADTIRERDRLRRHVKSLTAESRLSAVILVFLPFVIGALLFITSPGYILQLFSSTFGLAVVGLACLFLLAGSIWINQLIKVEV